MKTNIARFFLLFAVFSMLFFTTSCQKESSYEGRWRWLFACQVAFTDVDSNGNFSFEVTVPTQQAPFSILLTVEGNFSDSGNITGDILQGNTIVGSFTGGIGVIENTVVDGYGTWQLDETFSPRPALDCDYLGETQFFSCIN